MKRSALFVGVNQYEDPGINPLEYAENDATELYAFFKRSAGYDDVRRLSNPNSEVLLETVEEMLVGLGQDDLFLFFFAGHGVEHEKRHLLLCPRVRYGRLAYFQQTVPVDLLKDETNKPGLNRIFILDACRTELLKGGRLVGGEGLRGTAGLRDIVAARKPEMNAGGFALLCSCDEGQQARELSSLRHGVFAAAFLSVCEERLQQGRELTVSDDLIRSLQDRIGKTAGDAVAAQRPWVTKSGELPPLIGRAQEKSGFSRRATQDQEPREAQTAPPKQEKKPDTRPVQSAGSTSTFWSASSVYGHAVQPTVSTPTVPAVKPHPFGGAAAAQPVSITKGGASQGTPLIVHQGVPTVKPHPLGGGAAIQPVFITKGGASLGNQLNVHRANAPEQTPTVQTASQARRGETTKAASSNSRRKALLATALFLAAIAAVAAFSIGPGWVPFLKKIGLTVVMKNDPEGQLKLGDAYLAGEGVEQDQVEAVRLYRMAAELGNVQAQVNLGICYHEGVGVTKDPVEAVKWYRKAAELGNPQAQNYLGVCYEDGTGVTKDQAEAVKWYRKAAELGNAAAQNNLGSCYYNGIEVKESASEAIKWYRKAAEQGNVDAQNNLGSCYFDGMGVKKNASEAVKWYRKAAEQGNAPAQNHLGSCYLDGTGVAKDKAEAVKWFSLSAKQGNANAVDNLKQANK
jgi:TPR repeat protein/uncharacterized caspase-like protein